MPSYTYALKARRLLSARGYPCEIKRNEKPGSEGCSWLIAASGECRAVLELLRSAGIPYTLPGGDDRRS